jgi:Cu/Ag efflux pump CusA
MISRIIDLCARNRFLVFTGVLLLTFADIWSLHHVPLDALPDISDVQVIVHTSWKEHLRHDRGITSTIHVLILVPVFFIMRKERALRKGTLHSRTEPDPSALPEGQPQLL